MDFPAPVQVQVDPNQGINNFSKVLGLAGQAQDLRTATAQADQAQQKNRELQSLSQLVQNSIKSGRWTTPEGEFDNAKASADIAQIAPVYGGDVASSLLSRASDAVKTRESLLKLSDEQRASEAQSWAALAGDQSLTKGKIIDEVTRRIDTAPTPGMKRALISTVAHMPNTDDPDELRAFANRVSVAAGGQYSESPSSIDTGAEVQPGAVNKFSGAFTPAGAPVKKQVGPGANLVSDMSGAQYILDPQTNTIRPVGTGKAPDSSKFKQPTYPGQKEDIAANQSEIRGIRTAGDSAPQAHNINDQILKLSANTSTGPGTAFWRSIPVIGGQFGDKYQELGKYLEKNAIANMSAMGGPPSDARLSAASAANGSTHFNPKALQDVTKFNDATTSGIEKFRQGADAAVGLENPDYTKLAKYKADWAKNFDVDVYRYANAMKRGDEAEIQEIEKDRGAKGMADLLKKRKALESLAKTGKLPE